MRQRSGSQTRARAHETGAARTFGLEVDVVLLLAEELLVLDEPFFFEQRPHAVPLVDALLAPRRERHDRLAITALSVARVVGVVLIVRLESRHVALHRQHVVAETVSERSGGAGAAKRERDPRVKKERPEASNCSPRFIFWAAIESPFLSLGLLIFVALTSFQLLAVLLLVPQSIWRVTSLCEQV